MRPTLPSPPNRDAFVQLLRNRHRALGVESQLTRRFLLHRGGNERRGWIALHLLLAHIEHGVGAFLQHLFQLQRILARVALEILVGDLDQLGAERWRFGVGTCRRLTVERFLRQFSFNTPVLYRHKRLNLTLTFDDQAHGHRLNPPRAQVLCVDFLPQKRTNAYSRRYGRARGALAARRPAAG